MDRWSYYISCFPKWEASPGDMKSYFSACKMAHNFLEAPEHRLSFGPIPGGFCGSLWACRKSTQPQGGNG